ncbi:unnamed protein product, partial [Polarella glacialis]
VTYNAVLRARSRSSVSTPSIAGGVVGDAPGFVVCPEPMADGGALPLKSDDRLSLPRSHDRELIRVTKAIAACGEVSHWQDAVMILAEMPANSVEADVVAWNTAMGTCSNAGQASK